MTFRPSNFKTLAGNPPPYKIREETNATLILVKATGEAMYGRTRGEKDHIVEQFNPETDLLLWPWVGQWHTDVFALGKEDLNKHYR